LLQLSRAFKLPLPNFGITLLIIDVFFGGLPAMDQNIAALVPLLPGYFGWNLARTKCLAGLIIALIKVRTVNFAQLTPLFPVAP